LGDTGTLLDSFSLPFHTYLGAWRPGEPLYSAGLFKCLCIADGGSEREDSLLAIACLFVLAFLSRGLCRVAPAGQFRLELDSPYGSTNNILAYWQAPDTARDSLRTDTCFCTALLWEEGSAVQAEFSIAQICPCPTKMGLPARHLRTFCSVSHRQCGFATEDGIVLLEDGRGATNCDRLLDLLTAVAV
jgi:hypothetical protein